MGGRPICSVWTESNHLLEKRFVAFFKFSVIVELEEPFSESDEEEGMAEARRKRQAKPQMLLPMPRRRIRTLSGTIPAVG